MTSAYVWTPIADLPEDWSTLGDQQARSLMQTWRETAGRLQNTGAYTRFLEKLRREWAIETGVLERLYTLSEGATKTLIEKGLDAAFISHEDTDRSPQQVIALIADQHAAIEGLNQFLSDQRHLSKSYLRELHSVLTAHQDVYEAKDQFGNLVTPPMIRGQWKSQPNNVELGDGEVFEFCPPEHVEAELDRLLTMHEAHLKGGVPTEVEAAWLHHRFTLIHPFVDGNGRVARCLATLIFLKDYWFPPVITRNEKSSYIEALRLADRGKLAALITLFGDLERKAIRHAFSLSEEVERGTAAVTTILSAGVQKLALRQKEKESLYQRAVTVADALHHMTKQRFDQLAAEINDTLPKQDHINPAGVSYAERVNKRATYNGFQITRCAKQLGYFANLALHPAWVELGIDTGKQTRILLAFHGLGHAWSGVIAVAAMAYNKERSEDGKLQIGELKPLATEPFEITFHDDAIEIEQRYHAWLEDRLIAGLAFWQESV